MLTVLKAIIGWIKKMSSLLLALLMGSGARGEITFVGSTSYSQPSSLSTATIDMSGITDLRANDYIICGISLVDAIASDVTGLSATDSSGSGLTRINQGLANDTNLTVIGVYAGHYTGTLDSGNLTIALPRGVRHVATVHVFRKVNTSTPIDETQSSFSFNSGQPDPAAVTLGDGQVAFAVGAMNGPVSTVALTNSGDLDDFEVGFTGSTRRSSIGAGYSRSTANPAAFGGGSTSTDATYVSYTYVLNKI